MRSSSMWRRPAVSTMTVSRPVSFASATPSRATATGSAEPESKTGMPIWRPSVFSCETAAGRERSAATSSG